MVVLEKKYYSRLKKYLSSIPFNRLFAEAVVEQKVEGRIYVDHPESPSTFYIVHNYGMSLLAGQSDNDAFNSAFRSYALNQRRSRAMHEWMQIFPLEWKDVLSDLFGDSLIASAANHDNITAGIVELNTRVNFQFDANRYTTGSASLVENNGVKIRDSTSHIYNEMTGSVIPKAFWDSEEDFRKVGVSFSAYVNNDLAATAFSSFVAPGKLELGIETKQEYRGHGLAELACAALIDHCLARNLEPIWSCRLENTGSYNLAKKLGFVPTLQLPYYRLSN